MMGILLWWSCINEAIQPQSEKPEELVVEDTVPEKPDTPPQIQSITFENPKPSSLESLRVKVLAHDVDNDRIYYDYIWSVNGKSVTGESRAFLPASRFKIGDLVSVEVQIQSREHVVKQRIHVTILNLPPVWKNDPTKATQVDGYIAQAEDPEGGILAYTLEGAPKGMSIDETTGKLSYTPHPQAKKGIHEVVVKANDPEGAFVQWSFSMEVK